MTTVAETRTRKPNRRKDVIPRVSLPFGPCTRPECVPDHYFAAADFVSLGFDPASIEAAARAFGPVRGPAVLATALIMRDMYAAVSR